MRRTTSRKERLATRPPSFTCLRTLLRAGRLRLCCLQNGAERDTDPVGLFVATTWHLFWRMPVRHGSCAVARRQGEQQRGTVERKEHPYLRQPSNAAARACFGHQCHESTAVDRIGVLRALTKHRAEGGVASHDRILASLCEVVRVRS